MLPSSLLSNYATRSLFLVDFEGDLCVRSDSVEYILCSVAAVGRYTVSINRVLFRTDRVALNLMEEKKNCLYYILQFL